jgi:hypothetical protein
MATRVLSVLLVVLGLALIAYSKFRLTPDRVSGFIEADEIAGRVGGRVRKCISKKGYAARRSADPARAV